ncbi:methyltransferase family protein [Flagellimonas pelagia]|uniref:Isoprenylcysteine carboxylmethyltransferase family protein n=1 Tax=Flagellimonas pelagia TaxID=2306998 RepID=A0A3A1NCE5_9FLAO|nr:isoprenylcysteine carboxylmethyltransferase family protein [Allomuricauda maritima]RIV42075.1 isoprenylcysteine carboxylmethyltransferase family protein [Allomuricauda maritima]TXJ90961.1 isoprenylcysteine carboxylmethyltransferase family protein [Allomuricauda maritima]
MRLRIPPALVMLIFGALMYVLAKFLPVGDFDFFGRNELAWFLFGLGFLIGIVAVAQFIVASTTTDPLHPQKTSKLITRGVFNYTRNPMYLGLLLILLAFGLKLGNAFNTLLAAGFVSYINRFQIKYEEEVLEEKFGKEYRIFCKLTRRWF